MNILKKHNFLTMLLTLSFAGICFAQETGSNSNSEDQPRRRFQRPSREEIEKMMDPTVSPDGYGIHDPVMIKQGEYYYVFSTNGGIKITRTKDMKNFERVGQVFDELPDWMPEDIKGINSLWAPDISYNNGMYYLYYSASSFGTRNSLIALTVNKTLDKDSPDYKWIDKGKIISSSDQKDYNAIDPNLFKDKDGQWYLAFGSFWSGIKIVKLNHDGLLAEPGMAPIALAERENHAVEAPFIIKHNEYYYLFVSFDLCCKGKDSTYKIMVGRSKDICGPYLDKNDIPMLEGGGTLLLKTEDEDRWKGPGHNAVFEDNESSYLVYHAYDSEFPWGMSAIHIRDLLWDKDLWPFVGEEISKLPAPSRPTTINH